MKIILAPTDFSKTARNAIKYAAEIAKRTKSKLIVLHVYHPPVAIGINGSPIVLPVADDPRC